MQPKKITVGTENVSYNIVGDNCEFFVDKESHSANALDYVITF